MTITAPLLTPRRHAEQVTIDGIVWRVVRMIDAYRAVLVRVVAAPRSLPVSTPVSRFEQKPCLTRLVILVLAAWRAHNRKAQS